MADVVGAFKVLIDAQPQSALDGFGKIVDASKKAEAATTGWGESIKVLNASLEITKTIGGALVSALGVVTDAASKAGSAFLSLADRGGAFREQQVQFSNFAASFGVNADEISKRIKDISSGTITLRDSFSLAGKGLAAGLDQGQLLTLLDLAKKKSEVTGESFQALGEKIISSAAKGGKALGVEFGIMVGESTRLSDVIAQASQQLERFGSTGFNASDILASINSTWTDLLDTVGKWLNEIPAVQSWFNRIAGAVGYFSDLIIENEQVFKEFVEIGLRSVEIFGKVFLSTFDTAFSGLGDIIVGGIKEFKAFFVNIVGAFGTVGDYAIAFYNTIVDVVSSISAAFTKIPAVIVSAFSAVGNFITNFTAGIAETILDAFERIFNDVQTLVATFPAIAEATGLDTFVRDAGRALQQSRQELAGVVDEQTTFFDTLARGFVETDLAREEFFNSLRADESKFSKNVIDVQNQIAGISERAIKDSLAAADRAGFKAFEDIANAKNQLDFRRNETDDRKAASDARAEQRRRAAEEKRLASELDRQKKKAAADAKREADQSLREQEKLNRGTDATFKDVGKDLTDAFGDSSKSIRSLYDDLFKVTDAANEASGAAQSNLLDVRRQIQKQIESENDRQERLVQVLERTAREGITHILNIEDAGKFVNGFLDTIFKEAGVRARMEVVKVAGV